MSFNPISGPFIFCDYIFLRYAPQQMMVMSSRLYLLLILIFFAYVDCLADPVSRALKALKKGKHQQVETVLNKSLEKHPVNPGARYAYSLLYFDSTYVNHNLDSAHRFIEQAFIDQQAPDSLEGFPLEKTGLTLDHLNRHKSSVDSAAFSRAAGQNTVESFQYFIDEYHNAPQIANAVSRRDHLAFETASIEDSYISYMDFLDRYPDAQQVPLARERYDRLVFQSKTAGGKLQDFVKFLQEHPETPYRDQAEWQIFQLGTLDDDIESYSRFKRNYPGSRYAVNADNILYHRNKEWYMAENTVSDSLKNVYQLESSTLIPIYENGLYGFIDRFGNDLIPPTFDSIPGDYLCQLLDEDVLQAFVQDKMVLMGRNQIILWDHPYDQVKDLGRGLLEIKVGNQYGVLHKSGWLVLEAVYDQIKFLGDSFLALQKDGKWGVSSMTGREIVPPKFETVEHEGAFFLFKKELWSVSNKQHLLEVYETGKEFKFEYQEWELVSHDYVMVFSGEKEGLLNRNLTEIIPLSVHEIHDLDTTEWFVKTSHGTIRFYGDQLQKVPPDRYQDFVSNKHFICLLKNPAWEVWDRSSLGRINEILYDSVAALGPHLMVLTQAGKSSVLFRNGTIVDLAGKDRVKLIRDADQSWGFLQVSTSGGQRLVYDLDGHQIYDTWYYEVSPLTPQLFIIEKNNLKGIVDLQGKVLLKPQYQTIVADSAAHISLLHNGRFGYFNPVTGSLIRPQYQTRMQYFDENILSTISKGKMGLIDYQNKVLLPFEYDQITHWSDSIIFARKEDRWLAVNLYTEEVVYKDISRMDWISGHKSHKAIIKTAEGYGLLDSKKGMLLNPGFNDIINLGTAAEPVFFTEKYIPEADYYVVIYYNQEMEVIRKQVFDSGNYDQVYCF